jgi:hypothetical protein
MKEFKRKKRLKISRKVRVSPIERGEYLQWVQ